MSPAFAQQEAGTAPSVASSILKASAKPGLVGPASIREMMLWSTETFAANACWLIPVALRYFVKMCMAVVMNIMHQMVKR